jgi:hypothetical protein
MRNQLRERRFDRRATLNAANAPGQQPLMYIRPPQAGSGVQAGAGVQDPPPELVARLQMELEA